MRPTAAGRASRGAPNELPESRGAALSLTGLRREYADLVAVHDVNLEVGAGEFLTLLGPSGSGKTTTLMMIAGFVMPSAGEIRIGDRAVTLLPAQKRGLGMVFQSYALFPHMTVGENIAFPLRMRKVGRREVERKVRSVLDLVGLPDHYRRHPRELSGGQQQRVALARALVFEPPVLLMDEPLGALDKKLREHMQREIKELQQRLNITVIYVTHDQEEALTMSDRIAVLNAGTVQQVGAPRELYEEPANAFVAGFLGESNLVRGRALRCVNDLIEIEHAGGQTFWAVHRALAAADQEVVVCVRPEHLRIARPDDTVTGNRWRGRVVDVVYVGDVTRYMVAVPGQILVAKQQNSGTAWHPVRGDDVDLVWEPHRSTLVGAGESRDTGLTSDSAVSSHAVG